MANSIVMGSPFEIRKNTSKYITILFVMHFDAFCVFQMGSHHKYCHH